MPDVASLHCEFPNDRPPVSAVSRVARKRSPLSRGGAALSGDAPLWQIAAIPLFAGLPEFQLAALAEASREKSYGKDAWVFLKGDRPSGLFAIVSGSVKIACQSPSGGEKILDLLGPGQVFGDASLLLDCPYPYSAAALSHTCLMHVDGGALHALIHGSPGFSRRMLSRLSQGIYAIIDDLEDYRTRAPRERIVRFLLDQCGLSAQARPVIAFPAPKHIFASRLGMTPEALSRGLRDLRDAGLIEVGKVDVRVLDRHALKLLLD
jgi:CRP-like cAMP-binding protein